MEREKSPRHFDKSLEFGIQKNSKRGDNGNNLQLEKPLTAK